MSKHSNLTQRTVLLIALASAGMGASQIASAGNDKGDKGDDKGGPLGTLLLFQKCTTATDCPAAGTGPWPVNPKNGAQGNLSYSLWGKLFRFSFSGEGLAKNTSYTLIYYPDPWPGSGLVCLATGKTTRQGKINLSNPKNYSLGESLPHKSDANWATTDPGAKIWLVPTSDVNCTAGSSMMLAWNPQNILFEYNPIVYSYPDPYNPIW